MPPMMSPAVAERLALAARDAALAAHGGKGAIWQAAATDLGKSLQTVMRLSKEITVKNPRKRRADAGRSAVLRDEAEAVAALMLNSYRKNPKRLLSFEQAIDTARANGLAKLEAIDPITGEIRLLCVSTVIEGMKKHGYHPDTLLRPAPAVSLASLHPNHVWQIDASICVLYYLKAEKVPGAGGLQVMDADKFYKNKPANLARIENERVWRYAVTDHTSGHIYVEYVLGAESGENLCNIFINAIQKRPDEPVHGVPLMAMLDPGSANTGALFRNLCKALQVRVLINQVGAPRAKGQVEQAHNLIECSFESRLKLMTVHSLDELNAEAAQWRRWLNGTSVHSRHGRTRYEAWLRISAEQLRLAPEVAICRELATTAPEERTVSDKLQVSFRGTTYDVSTVPNVQNRDKVLVARNPWRPDGAQVVAVDGDGREVFYVLESVGKDATGFDDTAVVIGERYARHADTPAQTAAKAIEKRVMGEDTLEGAAAARKARRLPFGGKVDPRKHMENDLANAPAYLPRRGTALATPLPGVVAQPSALTVPAALQIEEQPLSVIQAAGRLIRLVEGWSATHYQQLARDYPQGILESELVAVADRFNGLPQVAGRIAGSAA
jgi:transposase InsO family protein